MHQDSVLLTHAPPLGWVSFPRKTWVSFNYKSIEICPLITNTVQTCVVHGINKADIGRMIVKNNLTGIDRIVPVGHSLDIGVIWDGYDLIRQFTRIVHAL